MLVLTAFIEVAVADRDAIRAALVDVVAATRAEDGCEDYGCYEDTERPGHFVFVERWRDKTALDHHLATPHMAAWMKVAGPRLKSATGYIYDVASMIELRPK
jgi:quinol monooxygenase YgiN